MTTTTTIVDPIAIFLGLSIFFTVMVTIFAVYTSRRSQKYRKYLTDMYISAKIREIAEEKSLDLAEESKEFLNWCKDNKIERNNYDLDNAIEEELMEEIGNKDKE